MFKSRLAFLVLIFLFLFILNLNLDSKVFAGNKAARIVAKIKNVGMGPDNLAFAPDGTRLFVSGIGSIFSIDTTKNISLGNFSSLVGGTDPNGSDPSTLVFATIGSKNFNFATNFAGNVAVVDVNKVQLPIATASGSTEAGLIDGVVSRDGTVLYAVNKLTSRISLFPIFEDKGLQKAFNGGFINGVGKGSSAIVVSLDGKFAYVANKISQDIAIVDLVLKKVAKKIPLNGSPTKLAISSKGDRLYVTLNSTGQLAIIDTTTTKVLTIISQIGEGSWGIALNTTGSRAYITNSMTGDVTIVNTTNSKIIQKIPKVGLEPRGLVLSPKEDKLYVADFLGQSITVISLKNTE